MKIRSIIKRSFKVKWFIFWLVFLLSFISFWYSDNVATLLQTIDFQTKSYTKDVWSSAYYLNSSDSYSVCFTFRNFNWNLRVWIWRYSDSEPWTNFYFWNDWAWNYVCINKWSVDRYIMVMPLDSTTSIWWDFFSLNTLLETELPLMTSLQCQSEYSLIPVSSIDSNYCSSNWLCPSYYVHLNEWSLESESALITSNVNLFTSSWIVVNSVESPLNYYFNVSPDLSGWSCYSWNWSALYINDIQHESAPLINLTIPEEFDRDYTNNNEEFNLWVSWYNVDTTYIDWIITTQKTLPDKQDFNNTISWLLPLFIPWLVIIACLYFIFRFIKKVF